SDVYSLGSTLWTVLAGHPPFFRPDDDHPMAMAMRAVSEPLPPFPRADVPPDVVTAITTMLARDPAARFPSAAAAGAALQACQRRHGIDPTPLVGAEGVGADEPVPDDGTVAWQGLPVAAPAPWEQP